MLLDSAKVNILHNSPGWAISRETIEKNKHKASWAPPNNLLPLCLPQFPLKARRLESSTECLKFYARWLLKWRYRAGSRERGRGSLQWPYSQSGTGTERLLHFWAGGVADDGGVARLELQIQHNVPLSFMHSLYKLGTMNFSTLLRLLLLLLLLLLVCNKLKLCSSSLLLLPCRWQRQRRRRWWRRRRQWQRWQLIGYIQGSLQQDGGHIRGHQLTGGQQPESWTSAHLLVSLSHSEGSAAWLCASPALQEVQGGPTAQCHPLRGRLSAGESSGLRRDTLSLSPSVVFADLWQRGNQI